MSRARCFVAECAGTAMLLSVVVGSGIMGDRLAGGNQAVALLANSVATGAALVVLIHIFNPVSGAHFNPAVTMMAVIRRELALPAAAVHILAQVAGAFIGVWIAHVMFAEPILQISAHPREGWGQGFSEMVATFGLIGTILGTERSRPAFTPVAVGLYITAAYWFTASTSFANPAVTLARILTDTFAGIAPSSMPLFIAAQLAGTVSAVAFFSWLFKEELAR